MIQAAATARHRCGGNPGLDGAGHVRTCTVLRRSHQHPGNGPCHRDTRRASMAAVDTPPTPAVSAASGARSLLPGRRRHRGRSGKRVGPRVGRGISGERPTPFGRPGGHDGNRVLAGWVHGFDPKGPCRVGVPPRYGPATSVSHARPRSAAFRSRPAVRSTDSTGHSSPPEASAPISSHGAASPSNHVPHSSGRTTTGSSSSARSHGTPSNTLCTPCLGVVAHRSVARSPDSTPGSRTRL